MQRTCEACSQKTYRQTIIRDPLLHEPKHEVGQPRKTEACRLGQRLWRDCPRVPATWHSRFASRPSFKAWARGQTYISFASVTGQKIFCQRTIQSSFWFRFVFKPFFLSFLERSNNITWFSKDQAPEETFWKLIFYLPQAYLSSLQITTSRILSYRSTQRTVSLCEPHSPSLMIRKTLAENASQN
jgi:hypothetical protein